MSDVGKALWVAAGLLVGAIGLCVGVIFLVYKAIH